MSGQDDGADARAFFGRHAADYAVSEGHRRGADLEMVVAALAPVAGRRCLDVATGTGFCALALARAGGRVTAVDVTVEMLAQTVRLAHAEGVEIAAVAGDAADLPFDDASFERVSCRRAAHHFEDVAAFLREAWRVLVPGGLVCVADMAPPGGASDLQNALERLRDASHRLALTPQAWHDALWAAGFEAVKLELWLERQDRARWLYPVDDPDVQARVDAAVAAAPPDAASALGLRDEAGGGWSLVKQRIVIAGRRPR
jgi:SAM-dependent methyltransferase